MRAPTYRLSAILPLALVAALGGFLFGFDSGVINGAVNALSDEFGVAGVKTGLAVSLMLLGCAVGAFLAGTLADRFGRKPCMIATAVAFAISGMGSALAFGVGDFIFWRLLGGFAVGAASVLAPAYISEIAQRLCAGGWPLCSSWRLWADCLWLFSVIISSPTRLGMRGSPSGSDTVLGDGCSRWRFYRR